MKNIIAKYKTISEVAIHDHEEVRVEKTIPEALTNIIKEHQGRLLNIHLFKEEDSVDIEFMEV